MIVMPIRKNHLAEIVKKRLTKDRKFDRNAALDIAGIADEFPECTPQEFAELLHEVDRDLGLKLVPVFEKNGRSTTRLQSYDEVHRGKVPHLAVQVLVLTPDDRVVLRHRTNYRKWDISASGHVRFGETPLEAARRVLREKLDIDLPPERFVSIKPPQLLPLGFVKWGRRDSRLVPSYAKNHGIFRYTGRDQENYEINALFVARLRPSETWRVAPERFGGTDQVDRIRIEMAGTVEAEIAHDPDSYASGVRQYFQDPEVRDPVIKKVFTASRTVYAFDYDETIERKNKPLRHDMARLLARLVVEKGARIAIMSAKSMGESAEMEKEAKARRIAGEMDEASRIENALARKLGILEFAVRRILEEIENLIGVDLSNVDTSNWLILFPSKSNSKWKYFKSEGGDDVFSVVYEKKIDASDVKKIEDVLQKDFLLIENGASSTAHYEKMVVNHAVTKILIRPFGNEPDRDISAVRDDFVVKLRRSVEYVVSGPVEIAKGGRTSVDITQVGKDFGITHLFDEDQHRRVFYFGDDPGGSDSSVFLMNQKPSGLTVFDVSHGKEEVKWTPKTRQ